MSRWYLDTSAALKLLVEEPESAPLAAELDDEEPDLVACWLLETELRRSVVRLDGLTQEHVTGLLDAVSLHAVPASLFREAGLLPGAGLRSLDAIHLAAALRLGVDRMVTYDRRLADASRAVGVVPASPA